MVNIRLDTIKNLKMKLKQMAIREEEGNERLLCKS